MRIRSKMTRNVITVDPVITLSEAYEIMRDSEIRHLPVTEGSRLVGVVSERDLLLRAEYSDEQIQFPELEVSDIMTTDVLTCHENTNVADAALTLIENKVGCLPVVREGELVGLVTTTDLLQLIADWKDDLTKTSIPFNFEIHRYDGRESLPRPWNQDARFPLEPREVDL